MKRFVFSVLAIGTVLLAAYSPIVGAGGKRQPLVPMLGPTPNMVVSTVPLNGDLITTNGDAVNGDPTEPSELVEFTPEGRFVAQRSVNFTAQGGAFGIALRKMGNEVFFAAVDDVLNNLDVWILR